MKTVSVNLLKPIRMAKASLIFMNEATGEKYFATRKLANYILMSSFGAIVPYKEYFIVEKTDPKNRDKKTLWLAVPSIF